MSSIYASYVLTALLALALATSSLMNSLLLGLLAALSVGLQLPLLIGVIIAKTRTSLPPETGHFSMFPDPEPLANISWARALSGFLATGVLVAVALLRGGG